MAAKPGMIGGHALARGENSGDSRNFRAPKQSRGAILLQLWKYLGRNRLL